MQMLGKKRKEGRARERREREEREREKNREKLAKKNLCNSKGWGY